MDEEKLKQETTEETEAAETEQKETQPPAALGLPYFREDR